MALILVDKHDAVKRMQTQLVFFEIQQPILGLFFRFRQLNAGKHLDHRRVVFAAMTRR